MISKKWFNKLFAHSFRLWHLFYLVNVIDIKLNEIREDFCPLKLCNILWYYHKNMDNSFIQIIRDCISISLLSTWLQICTSNHFSINKCHRTKSWKISSLVNFCNLLIYGNVWAKINLISRNSMVLFELWHPKCNASDEK